MAKQANKKSSPLGTIIGILILFSFISYIFPYLIIAIIILIAVVSIGYIILAKQKKKSPEPTSTENAEFSVTVNFGNRNESPKEQIEKQLGTNIDLGEEYVQLSTAGDESVCPMCAQFEGKIFRRKDAPKLPLCPSCSCAYKYYYEKDLPDDAIISNKGNFTLPAECTPLFHKHQQELYKETDTAKIIRLCEADLKKLPEFMTPYLSAHFPAPGELICRDLLPNLYMQLGQWDKAEAAIQKCIEANAYYPDHGLTELSYLACYRKVATNALSYIEQNPGCLQSGIYKKLSYEGDDRETLKDFLRCSKQIKKIKHGNTNELYLANINTV